jgi:hypothetical protein
MKILDTSSLSQSKSTPKWLYPLSVFQHSLDCDSAHIQVDSSIEMFRFHICEESGTISRKIKDKERVSRHLRADSDSEIYV